jgi:hypothetical protein
MNKMNQKEAVYKAITEVTGKVHSGEVAVQLDDNSKAKVKQILVEGFKSGNIEIGIEKNEQQLKSYVNGLLDNWLRKDKRLNGNTKYEIKNPGTRSGSGDEAIREMRKLLKTGLSDTQRAAVEAAIATRLAEIKPVKEVEINASVLPADLLKTLGI